MMTHPEPWLHVAGAIDLLQGRKLNVCADHQTNSPLCQSCMFYRDRSTWRR